MKAIRLILVLTLVFGGAVAVSAQSSIDVTIVKPDIRLQGSLSDAQSAFDNALQGSAISQLETQIEGNADLQKFATLPNLSLAAANAGATAAHLGTQRAFSDYRAFALVVGTGVGISAPSVDPNALSTVTDDLEQDGDIYVGAAVQPVTASLGVNLSRWIPRTRADVKLGYANIGRGTISDEISFNALSVGVGINRQILQSRQLPLGFLRWRGLTVASGFIYQRNKTDIEVQVTDQAFEQAITYGDFLSAAKASAAGVSTSDTFATLSVSPTVNAAIESKTYSIPLEVTTGLRLLWLLDVNFGAGVDLVFGESNLVFGGDAVVAVDPDPAADQYLTSTPGSISFGVSNSESPQFLRPRLTAGLGVNLGKKKKKEIRN